MDIDQNLQTIEVSQEDQIYQFVITESSSHPHKLMMKLNNFLATA